MKSPSSHSTTKAPLDFKTLRRAARPGASAYDGQLPSNYEEVLPEDVVDAFKAMRFEWGGVPEWVPPVGVR